MSTLEMEDNLFPEDIDDIDEELLADEEDTFSGYKQGPYFDTEKGDLLLNGTGQVLIADEVNVWATWCEKIISTPRYSCDLYSTDIGIDYEEVFAADDREEAESIIESQISEALTVDPYGRTLYVESVEFDWISADSVRVEVLVVGIENERIVVGTTITK